MTNGIKFRNKTHRDQYTIDDVRYFWDNAPLWVGESEFAPGTLEFFEEHRSTVISDCFAGTMDEAIFPAGAKNQKVLDLGCGIGFWPVEFAKRGYTNLHAADLSNNSLKIARQRCNIYNIRIKISQQNAEGTTFEDGSFDHVNCQGVVHHTPSPVNAMREIERILRPGGTASISVYYKNSILRNWATFRGPSRVLGWFGGRLKGRGREDIYQNSDIKDIVRRYDGADNPIGIAFDKSEFELLIGPGFEIESIYFHFFPARSLPLKIPRPLHRYLDRMLPFMIYANVKKTDVDNRSFDPNEI